MLNKQIKSLKVNFERNIDAIVQNNLSELEKK